MVLVNILCTASGPGSASLAARWSSSHGLTNVEVWGDTEDYIYSNFAASVGGAYPSSMVVDLDTMELRYFDVGDVHAAISTIEEIVNADHPCAEE